MMWLIARLAHGVHFLALHLVNWMFWIIIRCDGNLAQHILDDGIKNIGLPPEGDEE